MSSLIAHLAAGATAYACRSPRREPKPFDGGLLAACVVLAVLPDLDYLLWWAARIHIEPRITHSLGFAVMSAGLAWLLLRLRAPARTHTAPGSAAPSLLAAALSHELLDFLVGVHASPWLWPFMRETFVSPIRLLPSAGRLDLTNFYLWRNLLIEAGVLGPALLALCAMRRPGWRLPRPMQFGLAITAGLSLSWSMSLPR